MITDFTNAFSVSIEMLTYFLPFIKVVYQVFPDGASGKTKQKNPTNAGDMRRRFDPWVGNIPWRRAWHPLQYSCLENPMDRGAWQATVHGITKSDMTEAT